LRKLKNLSDEVKKNLLIYFGIFVGIPLWIYIPIQMTFSDIKILEIIGLLMLIIPLGYIIAFILHFLIVFQLALYEKAKQKYSGISAFLIAYIPFVILFMLLFLLEPGFVEFIGF
jgi:hypothetical protein